MSVPLSSTGLTQRLTKARSMGSAAPIVGDDHVFEVPAKLIKTPADMRIWEKSEAYYEYLGFILAINEAIKGKSNSQGSENSSESVARTIGMLEKLDAIIDETPPIDQPQRFGNMAFRTWFQKMRNDALSLLQEIFKTEFIKGIPEVVSYLVDSFGNSTRIDYGTGHEISFIMFLCCLFKIGVLTDSDKVATGCYIFPRYLDLARKLQKTYRMEPAGSHGVWSLDDFQFVPFIWGSSQLNGHPTVEPHMFLQPQVLKEFGEDYMFLTCIQYINSVKTGPFAEHSNQLWSISGVSSWLKINGGLIKMYKAEVLSKFPVVQHMLFGSLFTLKPVEQCSGMMTPKFPMGPPPSISAVSTRESSKASLQSGEVKSSSSSTDSMPSAARAAAAGSLRGSVKDSFRGSHRSAMTRNTHDSAPPSLGGSIGIRSGGNASVNTDEAARHNILELMAQSGGTPRRVTDAYRRRDADLVPPEEPDENKETVEEHAPSEASESVRFSEGVEGDEEHHARVRTNIKLTHSSPRESNI